MDWIDEFMSLTEHLRIPKSFKLWTAIQTIACVLERRVWTETDIKPLRPNLYTILTGGPASGKTAMVSLCRDLLVDLTGPQGLFLGPDNPTKASFLDYLSNSSKAHPRGHLVYSAMSVLCMELQVLISKYEKDFVADLTSLYDNLDNYTAPRRTSKSLDIPFPTLNILAAATPSAIGDIMPDTAWDQGFTSRLLFIYGTPPEMRRNILKKRKLEDYSKLKSLLKEYFYEFHGQVDWENPASEALDHWYNDEKMAPVPDYGRLANYAGRREQFILKLSMISAVSAGNGLTVSLKDFRRAQQWLFEAEETMPDVFRAMAQKSDTQILQDAHRFFWTKYNSVVREKRKALTQRDIWSWFENKVPNEKIDNLVQTMEKTERLRKGMLPGEWFPNPLNID